jgi:hypothetical protein
MKKLLTMMLALFMVVGMTGCGSTPADQTDNNDQGNENIADVIIIGAGGANILSCELNNFHLGIFEQNHYLSPSSHLRNIYITCRILPQQRRRRPSVH